MRIDSADDRNLEAIFGAVAGEHGDATSVISFHAGYAYFELDQTHDLWDQLKDSGGVAIYVSGEFPGLAMELWAIRG